MTTTFLHSTTKMAHKNTIAFIAILLFSTVGMFAQNVNNEIVAPENGITVSVASANLNTTSQMELVSWFMGSKPSQLSNNNASNATSTNNSGKKQLINCGATPNRILSRAFLKKAINHDSTIA